MMTRALAAALRNSQRPAVPISSAVRAMSSRRLRRGLGLHGLGGLGDTGDPLIWWTPGELDNLAKTIDREIQAVGAAVTKEWAAGHMSSAQRAPWKKFYDDWMQFNKSRSWLLDFLTAASLQTLQKFRQQAREWNAQLAEQGVKAGIPIPPPKPPGKKPEWIPYARWGLGIVGLLAVGKIVSAFR